MPVISLLQIVCAMSTQADIAVTSITGSVYTGKINGILREGGTNLYIIYMNIPHHDEIKVCVKAI